MEIAHVLTLIAFLYLAGPGVSDVSGSSRSKMTGSISDASDVTWAHAVNSRDALEKALAGPVDFLEADISLGRVAGNDQPDPIPIMAHPPETTSDISLESWIYTVVSTRPEKRVKLDFKSIDVLEPALIILQKYSGKLNSSVWLNADVLPGPINSKTTPVAVENFLTLCQQYFPNATLSIGWTTQLLPTYAEDSWHYGWQHVREMADVIQCRGYETNHPRFTFPVRGLFASRSIRQLQWLVSTVPDSTLTVWSSQFDPLQLEDLLRIRASFPKEVVFYDVPEYVLRTFRQKRDTVVAPSNDLMPDDGRWMTLTRGPAESCSDWTYARNDVIVFGKSLTTAVLHKDLVTTDNLRITGKIKFFDAKEELLPASEKKQVGEGGQELAIALADVSLFAKNESAVSQENPDLTISDTDVIWSAMNSSAVFTFRHEYGQKEASCRIFKLDSSQDKTFEAWTIPCDEMDSSLPENGIPEVAARTTRLVLTKGPFMLGFVSSGNEHVAVYDLKIESRCTTPLTSGSGPNPRATLRKLFSLISLFLYSLSLLS